MMTAHVASMRDVPEDFDQGLQVEEDGHDDARLAAFAKGDGNIIFHLELSESKHGS